MQTYISVLVVPTCTKPGMLAVIQTYICDSGTDLYQAKKVSGHTEIYICDSCTDLYQARKVSGHIDIYVCDSERSCRHINI